MENWQTILYSGMRSQAGPVISAMYFISWIFIGNFILLNLFLAILLDSFLVEEQEEAKEKKQEEDTQQKIENKLTKEQKKRNRADKQQGLVKAT